MKHLIIATFIALVTLTSCGVSKQLLYGDITIMDMNGNIIEEYDCCAFTYESYNNSKTNNGLLFYDMFDKPHYVNGGIVTIKNIANSGGGNIIERKSEEIKTFSKQKIFTKHAEQEFNIHKEINSHNISHRFELFFQ